MELELFDDNIAKEKITNYNTISTCPICLDEMITKKNYCIIECAHEFHSSCLINWFRAGNKTCPICRSEGEDHHLIKTVNTLLKMKINYWKKNSNAPKEFTKIVNNYLQSKDNIKKLEKERKEENGKIKELRKEENNLSYHAFMKIRNEIYSKLYKLQRKIRKEKHKKYDLEKTINAIPIQPIILLKKKVNRK